jgi:hypothetical protein
MTWFCEDLDAEAARLEGLGWPCVLDMTGFTGTRALFHDARPDLGHFIELYAGTPQVRRHYDLVARAARAGMAPARSATTRPWPVCEHHLPGAVRPRHCPENESEYRISSYRVAHVVLGGMSGGDEDAD